MPGTYAPDGSINVNITGTPTSSGGSIALTPQVYTLLTNSNTTGPTVSNIRGANYIWRVSGTFGGATATLQILDLDGSTWVNVRNQANTADVSFTASGSTNVSIGQGASVRVALTSTSGTTSLNSNLAGIS